MGTGGTSIPDSEYLRLIALSPDPIVTAGELADQLPVTQQAVNKRLDRLEKDGWITSKTVGSSAVVYWLTDAGRKELAASESRWRSSSESQ